jgi:hypothetical protein
LLNPPTEQNSWVRHWTHKHYDCPWYGHLTSPHETIRWRSSKTWRRVVWLRDSKVQMIGVTIVFNSLDTFTVVRTSNLKQKETRQNNSTSMCEYYNGS